MSEQSDVFYPNALKLEDVDALASWQLLVAACHFGPTMGDCVSLNYGYYLKGDTIYYESQHGADIALTDDIDISNPSEGLFKYAVKDGWRGWTKGLIEQALKVAGEEV